MVGVVQTDADELARARDRRPEADGIGRPRQACRIDGREARQPRRGQHFTGNVSDNAAEIPDVTILIQQAGPLGPGFAVSQQFHGSLRSFIRILWC